MHEPHEHYELCKHNNIPWSCEDCKRERESE